MSAYDPKRTFATRPNDKVKTFPGPFLDFLDPWGNRIEIVGYDNIQFTKAPNVLRGMEFDASVKERESNQRAH
jgi:hypothetical protein